MALLEVKTSYATYTDCTLRVGQYQMDGSIAVEIFSRREGQLQGLPFVCAIQHQQKMKRMWIQIIALGQWISWRRKGWQNRLEERDVADIVFIHQ